MKLNNSLFALPVAALTALAACSSLEIAPDSAPAERSHPAIETQGLPDGSIYHGQMEDGFFHGTGELILPSGGSYVGEFRNGLMNGLGKFVNGEEIYEGHFEQGLREGLGVLVGRNGYRYEGQFHKGAFSGYGRVTFPSGDNYRGQFQEGLFVGDGEYQNANGDVYRGVFANNILAGKGLIEFANGNRYEGEIKDWQAHGLGQIVYADGSKYHGSFVAGAYAGDGLLVNTNGDSFAGEFSNGSLNGYGKAAYADGTTYIGNWSEGSFSGFGSLFYRSGNGYEGQFDHGKPHGEGRVLYGDKPLSRHIVNGVWENGVIKLVTPRHGESGDDEVELDAESILFDQSQLVAYALDNVEVGTPGIPDLFVLSIAGYGTQDVFMKEATYARTVFESRFGARNHSLMLVNNMNFATARPLATTRNIQAALTGLSKKMRSEEDILLLFITTHGSPGELALNLGNLPLNALSVSKLADAIRQTRIKKKIIILSACFSGSFIDALRDDDSVIITSARADRSSFGCGDDDDLTYFGRAFLEQALNKTHSIEDAFEIASNAIREWESREHFTPSEPQLFVGKKAHDHLQQWLTELRRHESGSRRASVRAQHSGTEAANSSECLPRCQTE